MNSPRDCNTASDTNQGWFWSMFIGELGWFFFGLRWGDWWKQGVLGGVLGGSSSSPSNNGWKDSSEGILGILIPWK